MTSPLKALSAVLLLISFCSATDIRDHLVGVQRSTVRFSFPPTVERVQGSGICIDHSCSVVATAYHVQRLVGRANLGVASSRTDKVLSLANESDTNKSDVPAGKTTFSYNIANDVSFVYTKEPVPHKSGTPYSYACFVGQKVIVAGYHNHEFETKEARIIGVNVPLVVGQAQLTENLILDVPLNPGTSGRAVLDERGNLLGMIVLSGELKVGGDDIRASVALTVRTLAKALVKLDPALGSSIFNEIPEEPQRGQPLPLLYHDSDLPDDTSPVIPELSSVPSDVTNSVGKLRANSKAASALMVNFVAKECLVQGTQKPVCHELSIINGHQTYQRMGKNDKLGKRIRDFPVQKNGLWTQSDWADALGEIADNPWVFRGSVNDYYLFTHRSIPEDDRCYWEEYKKGSPLFGGGNQVWKGAVACFEQILTDRGFNVLSVFTELHPPNGCAAQLVQIALYYEWIKLEGVTSPVLLPVKERITAKMLGHKNLWYANMSWTDYKEFRADHKVQF